MKPSNHSEKRASSSAESRDIADSRSSTLIARYYKYRHGACNLLRSVSPERPSQKPARKIIGTAESFWRTQSNVGVFGGSAQPSGDVTLAYYEVLIDNSPPHNNEPRSVKVVAPAPNQFIGQTKPAGVIK